MRIAVMAAGAVGGYFGARLAAAGHDVVFFARGANLEAIRRDGLTIESVHGNLHLKDVKVSDDPSKVVKTIEDFYKAGLDSLKSRYG